LVPCRRGDRKKGLRKPTTVTSRDSTQRLRIYALLLLFLVTLSGAYALVDRLGFDPLPLGSAFFPRQGYAYFLTIWSFLGAIASLALALALARSSQTPTAQRLRQRLRLSETTDATWIVVFSIAGFAIPALVRTFALQFTPLTDDEAIYRFTAELIASGSIAAPRPPEHLFWDRAFMVIDDHMYGQYFLGWPAVLAVFKRLGLEELAGCLCAALTVPPLYLSSLRLGGPLAARVTAALFVFSPMLMIGSATLMSHASCLCANAWAFWFFLRAREPESKAWESGGFALLVSIAFFIRPFTTVALCIGLVVIWLSGAVSGHAKLRKLTLFGLISGAMATLFLLANYELTGHPLYVPYQRAMHYVLENQYRFGYFGPQTDLDVVGLALHEDTFAKWLASLLRYSYAVGGWPIGFLFLPFARGRNMSVVWLMLVSYIGFHVLTTDGGVDPFGPPHYYELSLPFLILSGNGASQLQAWATSQRSAFPQDWISVLPLAAVAALVITSMLGFTVMRLKTVHKMTDSVRRPLLAIEGAGIHNAILFRSGPHSTFCDSAPARHFVFWPPHNDPNLENDVLWANHLSVEWDKALIAEHFPGRKGYIYFWETPCRLTVVDLDQVRPGTIENASELSFKQPLAGPDD